MGLKWLLFLRCPLLVGYETHEWYKDGEQIHVNAVITLFMVFSAHMSILFDIKVKNLLLVKWSCSSFKLC